MKLTILTLALVALTKLAAIGCLPGDCCNGHPCISPIEYLFHLS